MLGIHHRKTGADTGYETGTLSLHSDPKQEKTLQKELFSPIS